MRGIIFGNSDLHLIIKEDEFNSNFLEEGFKESRLECPLNKMYGEPSDRTISIEYSDFENKPFAVSDGIKTTYDLKTKHYTVQMNEKAITNLNRRGEHYSRQGNDAKLEMYIEEKSPYHRPHLEK